MKETYALFDVKFDILHGTHTQKNGIFQKAQNNWGKCQKNEHFNKAFQSVFIAAGSETDTTKTNIH